MTRLPQFDPHDPELDPERRELLADTQRQLGRTPNLYRAMAASPAVLRGYLALRETLQAGSLSALDRERLALFVAQENRCGYCVAAHAMRGGRMGLDATELISVRQAHSADPRAAAILRLASGIMRTHGKVDDDLLIATRANQVTDAEIAEVVAHIALNTLSNLFNHVAQPDLDFPPVAEEVQVP